MIDTKFLDQLGRFSLVIHKRVTSKFSGPRHSLSVGRGITFKEHRLYAPGDDFRSIDWKIYARTDDLFLKTYEEEKNLVVHIIVDYSGSMGFGKPVSKFDYASMLGVGFAFLAMKENEKFQFSTFADNLEVFQPRRGMSQLAGMIFHLNSLKTKGHSKLIDNMSQYKKVIGSRSLIILISDFLLGLNEIGEALSRFGNHEVKIVQVLDPVEKNLNMEGDLNLIDSEKNDHLRTYISPSLRLLYQNQLSEHSAKVEELCIRLGMKFYQVTTDTPIFDTFYRLIE